ncbi:uncharacterized protein MELLADRAFT_109205 [Melampsora larici-populina 98AG31]|uniref:Secreted protein n=1 Tax=Melampsora larici-populina (strain 98AG31 / pathotype 3-4-7) TaxID=747676 RepID=F4RVQ5_MELLP|nr:uncharacterized protein MELLADRAFT_109205 [Melampsora larici-populina 98AG31]EGG03400.1 hypothetical protein MELLADRAFT_109205 [Melampsora larici-populina 98AG31]
MTRISFLSIHVILLLLPLLYCFAFHVPLLSKPAITKLDKNGDDLKTLLLEDSFTAFQAGQEKLNQGNLKSIIDTTKLIGTFKNIFKAKTRPKTPESEVLITWEVCYDIAQKIFESSESSEVKSMAKAVLDLGSDFDFHQHDPRFKMGDVISAITLHSISLENDSLDTAEKIWSVGVL